MYATGNNEATKLERMSSFVTCLKVSTTTSATTPEEVVTNYAIVRTDQIDRAQEN